MGEFLFELLLAIAELFLELAGEAILDFALRAIAQVFEDSEISSPVLASVGARSLDRRIESSHLSTSPCPPFKNSWNQPVGQPCHCRCGHVVDRFDVTQARQEGGPNRELRLRICFCFRHGAFTLFLCEVTLTTLRRSIKGNVKKNISPSTGSGETFLDF